MPLSTKVGISPGHIVLDEDPPPPQKGHSSPPLFGPYLLWPNGWMDQDSTSYGGRDLGPGDIVLDGYPAPLQKRAQEHAPPTFRPMFIVVKRSPISATAELLLNLIRPRLCYTLLTEMCS